MKAEDILADLTEAQNFSGVGNRITTLAINLDDNSEKNMLFFEKELNEEIEDPALVVKNWMEFNKALQQQIESDDQGGQVFMGLLYFIIFFGIFIRSVA